MGQVEKYSLQNAFFDQSKQVGYSSLITALYVLFNSSLSNVQKKKED
jgi:hypothetical protein